jgi:hypothetical protein
VKDKNGDLLTDSHSIVNRWKNYFSQLLNIHRVSDVRQIEIQTAEPLVPYPSPVEFEIAIANMKMYKSPGSDTNDSTGGEVLRSMINKLIISIWNKEELPYRKIAIHRAEPLVSDPSPFEVEIAIANVKMYKSPGSDTIPAELIQAGGAVLRSEINQLINSIWNKDELPYQRKEFIIVQIHEKGDKTDCNIYRGISLLSTLGNILSNIFLSKLNAYIDKIIREYQCGFRRNR